MSPLTHSVLVDDTPKATPTESDVNDMLNMAHGGLTKTNLKQVSM